MNLRSPLLALAIFWIAALLAACSAAPETPAEMFHGVIGSGCAPHDAPSTVIELKSTTTEARLSFNLWPTSGTVPPTTIKFDADHPFGQGAYCTGADECEPVAWGRIVLGTSVGTGSVEGEWTLGLADGRTYRGLFTADWLANQALCG
jgi:hypothetical protein